MSEQNYDLLFTTVKRGYDKEEVISELEKLQHRVEEAESDKKKLNLLLSEKEEMVDSLNERMLQHSLELEKAQKEAEENQKYKDNYDSIGELVFDARAKANKIIANAKDESEKILKKAKEGADAMIQLKQKELDERLRSGKRTYNAMQDELAELIDQVNRVQQKFMQSFKSIHEVYNSMGRATEEESFDSDVAEEMNADYELKNEAGLLRSDYDDIIYKK